MNEPIYCGQCKTEHIFKGDSKVCECKRTIKLEAARAPVDYRYDVLDSDFLHCMAQIGAYGAAKYGDFNYQKSRLTGDKSPLNHIFMHLHQYKLGIKHDKFGTMKHQLAAVAFNAMMEFWYLENMDERETQGVQ